ncbi:MAG: hypothetical protein JJU45_17685 [Acidimicrobiia bacterium]|nr:hypothetical protein [Acidimicrobiia bacterium]
MSPADSADGGPPARALYSDELEQLRLQVELMGVRVDENLERMRDVLVTGSSAAAEAALAADDEIDAMMVSLTERCYLMLAREAPVASDLRLVVSVVRITGEFERIGDLALRVAKMAPDHHLLTADARCHDVLVVMADDTLDRYRTALRAWATQDVELATSVTRPSCSLELSQEQLTERVLRLEGDGAVPIALRVTTAAKSLDRIADHTVVLGARMRYLLTGDPRHLAAEVR